MMKFGQIQFQILCTSKKGVDQIYITCSAFLISQQAAKLFGHPDFQTGH